MGQGCEKITGGLTKSPRDVAVWERCVGDFGWLGMLVRWWWFGLSVREQLRFLVDMRGPADICGRRKGKSIYSGGRKAEGPDGMGGVGSGSE